MKDTLILLFLISMNARLQRERDEDERYLDSEEELGDPSVTNSLNAHTIFRFLLWKRQKMLLVK